MRKIFFSQWRRWLWKKVYAGCSYEACNSVVSIWTGNQVISRIRLLFGAVAWGRAGGTRTFPPSFLRQQVKTCTYKSWKWKFISQNIETMMSLQLGETFSGLIQVQRPVQWLILTQNPLLFKYNELPKIFVPPPAPFLVSKGLLRPYSYWGYSKSFFKHLCHWLKKSFSCIHHA